MKTDRHNKQREKKRHGAAVIVLAGHTDAFRYAHPDKHRGHTQASPLYATSAAYPWLLLQQSVSCYLVPLPKRTKHIESVGM